MSEPGAHAKEDTWTESAATAGGFAAYGWPPTLTDAEIQQRLVALNAERTKEEASGLVRWLRPDYQNPGGAQTQQTALAAQGELCGDDCHFWQRIVVENQAFSAQDAVKAPAT